LKVPFKSRKDPLKKLIGRKKPVLVVGLGRSGCAAANMLARLGCSVVVSEMATEAEFRSGLNGLDPDVRVEWGGHPASLFLQFPLVVLSPGVPARTEAVMEAAAKGIKVIGEMELAFRLSTKPWVAVSGSNGKSTTTTLLGLFAKEAGINAVVGGNLGTPSAELVEGEKDSEFVVAEVSSFQLETMENFKPAVAVMLNVSPDHLDRYDSETDYVAAKSSIFANMDESCTAVVNEDDPVVVEMSKGLRAQIFGFSRRNVLETGVSVNEDWITIQDEAISARVLESGKVAMTGVHNLENTLAAVAAGYRMGIDLEAMARVLTTFEGLEHRMELVEYFRGVPIYNDSKGTNVGATLSSLGSIKGQAILIMGGKDKGAPYTPMKGLLRRKVSLLILIGEAAGKMEEELGTEVETVISTSLDEAVRTALDRARPGHEILFSPACSSFDMFENFEERGRIFKGLVRRYVGIMK